MSARAGRCTSAPRRPSPPGLLGVRRIIDFDEYEEMRTICASALTLRSRAISWSSMGVRGVQETARGERVQRVVSEGGSEDGIGRRCGIDKPEEINFILGRAILSRRWRISTRRCGSQCSASSSGWPLQASGLALVRWSGTDEAMIELAKQNASFFCRTCLHPLLGRRLFPVNVLNAVQAVPEVCRIFCATANPTEVIIAETEQGRGILGVIDGFKSQASRGRRRSR